MLLDRNVSIGAVPLSAAPRLERKSRTQTSMTGIPGLDSTFRVLATKCRRWRRASLYYKHPMRCDIFVEYRTPVIQFSSSRTIFGYSILNGRQPGRSIGGTACVRDCGGRHPRSDAAPGWFLSGDRRHTTHGSRRICRKFIVCGLRSWSPGGQSFHALAAGRLFPLDFRGGGIPKSLMRLE